MTDDETNQNIPPAPPGLPPMPGSAPPAPPGLPPMPGSAPPAPPGLPPMPGSAPPAPPGLPPMPSDAPPAPPGMPPMPEMPSMDAPPAPPGLPAMPEMPANDAPPAPPGIPGLDAPPAPPGIPTMPEMPSMDAPPAPPGIPGLDAPPAPPGMPPMPEMPSLEAPPAPPGIPGLDAPVTEEETDSDEFMVTDSNDEVSEEEVEQETVDEAEESTIESPLDPLAPPAPPGMPPMPEMPDMPAVEEPAADPLLAPPAPPADPLAPPAPPGIPPMPEMPAMEEATADPLLAPPAPPADPLAPPAPPVDLLAPPAPPADPLAPPAPPEMPAVEEAASDPLLAPASDPLAISIEQPKADPFTTTNPVQTGIAGAKIRDASDVDQVQGDKLVSTLEEVEVSLVNHNGEIIEQTVEGVLTVTNTSETDRIFDIDVILDNTESTSFESNKVTIDELDSGESHTTEYTVSGQKMLVLQERIDTNPDKDRERSLSVTMDEGGNTLAMEIQVENTCNVPLKDVVVTRELPSEMNIEVLGESEIEDGVLTWNVGTLEPGVSSVLSVAGVVTASSIDPISTGGAKATYSADFTLSTTTYDELDAFSRGFTFCRTMQGERPDHWKIQAIFENQSSFVLDLVKLQVRQKGSDDLLLDIHDVPEDVLPDGVWESEIVEIHSPTEPSLTWELAYTVLPRASATTNGTITVESTEMPVLEAKVDKTYSTKKLASFEAQDMTATVVLENTGSATINLMRITDDIPGLFSVPDLSAMKIKVAGIELDAEQFKAEVADGITLEETHISPDGPGHTLSVTVGTKGPIGLEVGDTLEMTYSLHAPDPTPANEKVAGPARIEFSSERFGPICSRDVSKVPTVKVIHNRRNIGHGKQAQKIGGRGRYEIMIVVENSGDTAVQDANIRDIIPAGFDIERVTVRGANREERTDVNMEESTEDGNTLLVWNVPVIAKGERISISFDIKGDGEVDSDLINSFHGVYFGADVEEEESEEAEEVEASEEESADVEASEEADDSVEDPTAAYKWREDVLEKVMAEHGIEDRDAFIAHAVKFDHDNNMYLKKVELTDAAKSFVEQSSEDSDDSEAEDSAESEDSGEAADDSDGEADSADSDNSETKPCPICGTENAADADSCVACHFEFN
ncbi:MAG: hypothetical protein ACPGAN_05175 [Candidatus Poseidoniaceae archaeon]